MINVLGFKKDLVLNTFLFVMIFIMSFGIVQPTIKAMTGEQQSLYKKNILYYDIGGCDQFGDSTIENSASNNKVYIMGDSYSVGIDKTLTKDLKTAGYDVVGKNEDNAGTITSNGGDGGTFALGALDKDKTKIAEAGSMDVFLGTNGGTQDIPKFMEKLNKINPTIKVYWMTVGYTKASDSDLQSRNKQIKDFSSQYNYTVVDWYGAYSNNQNLINATDNIHPTENGYKVLSKLFIDEMGKYNSNNASSTGGSNKYMTTDSTKKNDARVWQFLTSPDGFGLTAAQAAGAMGNIDAESSFVPGQEQIGGGGAYGLIQWDGGRRTSLENAAKKQGKKVSDLDFQLNYLKKEITSNSVYNKALKLLRKQTNVMDATLVWHGTTNLVKAPGGITGIESSGDSQSQVEQNRGGSAKRIFKKFTGTDPTSLSSGSSTSGDNKCLCAQETTSAPVVYLDPGHSGSDTNTIDPAIGVRDHDYPNVPEIDDAWDVAETAKKDLEKDGYKVILSKDKARETSNFRTKASKADNANADLAVSIHTDPSLPNTGWITIPKVGQYRTAEDGTKVEYKDSSAATVSKKDAEVFKTARQKNEGNDIIMQDISLKGRQGLAPGNIPLIMLMSKTPWVYLEKKAGKNGLSNDQKKKYADSIKDGVKASLPLANATSKSVGDCSGTSTNSGGIVDKILSYAWEDGRQVGSGGGAAKPAYMIDTKIARDKGKYVGANAGAGNLYTDCGAFTTRVMQNTVDKKYGGGGATPSQQQYVQDNKALYTALGTQKNTTKLQPGDIAIINQGDGNGANGHTFFFTGKINKNWKGNGASASGTQLVPHASDVYFSDSRGQYLWFRYK